MSADSETPRAHASGHRSQVRDKKILKFFNTGKGVEESEREKIFERFYRSDSSRARTSAGGYGLGLSIAKSIADAHRIKIQVESEYGSWICFVLTREAPVEKLSPLSTILSTVPWGKHPENRWNSRDFSGFFGVSTGWVFNICGKACGKYVIFSVEKGTQWGKLRCTRR